MRNLAGGRATPPARPRPPPNRRRDKPQLSCHGCRRRKLKCDRQQPCASCTKDNNAHTCSYPPPTTTSRPAPSTSTPSSGPHISAPQSEARPRNSVDQLSNPNEGSTVDNSTSICREGFHWTSVLNSISDIDTQKPGDPPEDHAAHIATALPQFVDFLLLGNYSRASRADLVATVPPKCESDRLVNYYFDTYAWSPVILHRGEFMKQYEDFWQDPAVTSAPTSWLALLFSVLTLATIFHNAHFYGSNEVLEPGSEKYQDAKRMENFREKTVQALVLAEHHKGGPFIVETLLNYLHAEQFIRRDADSGTWIVHQSLVSIVLSYGYHRDAKYFTSLSPYEAEMRRRLWSLIYQIDIGISTQLKMPKLIKDSIIDTQEPRNLFDTDFDAETTVMPESRPETELTPILITISKSRLASVSSKVLDAVTSKEPIPYSLVMELDSKLNHVFLNLPSCCKFTSMAESLSDAPNLACQRLFVQLIYRYIQIILHSKYLDPSLKTKENQYSRDTAVVAATEALQHQIAMDNEMHPAGRLYNVRWILSPVILHEFLLAGGVLCSYISNNPQLRDTEHFEYVTGLLKKSEAIWARTASKSAEALKGSTTIRKVLRQFESFPENSNAGQEESPDNIVSPVTPQDIHDGCEPSKTTFSSEFNEVSETHFMPEQTDTSPRGSLYPAQSTF